MYCFPAQGTEVQFAEGEQVIEEKQSPILQVPILSYLPKEKKREKQQPQTNPPMVDIVIMYILYNMKENRRILLFHYLLTKAVHFSYDRSCILPWSLFLLRSQKRM